MLVVATSLQLTGPVAAKEPRPGPAPAGNPPSLPRPGLDSPAEEAGDAGAPVEEDECQTHRELLRGALEGNEGNADGVDAFGSINHGRKAFNDRKLGGLGSNGRSCADCHMASDNFQLSPAAASARLAALLACRTRHPEADDPLFRPIDADDFRVNGAKASDFSNLTVNGLIRITFPLPATMRLVDPETGQLTDETEVDVWRAVPSVYNVKLTGPDPAGSSWFRGPNAQGGYQLDGRSSWRRTLEPSMRRRSARPRGLGPAVASPPSGAGAAGRGWSRRRAPAETRIEYEVGCGAGAGGAELEVDRDFADKDKRCED
jgi:hypothetical protein